MVLSKAAADAQVHLASGTNVVRLHSISWTVAAFCAVSFLRSVHAEMFAGSRISGMQACSTLAWCEFGGELLQQLVHQFFSEAQLTGSMLPN